MWLYSSRTGVFTVTSAVMCATVILVCCRAVFADTEIDPPPIPDVALTHLFPRTDFRTSLYLMWEPDHAQVSPDQSTVTLTLDQISGCGVRSLANFYHGFFSASIKLPGSYTAGVATTFYMSNNQDFPQEHDELDFEFLGTIPGEPYTLQTNAYGSGRTDIGREQRYRLWFDPTADFHDYSFLWDANHTVFFVDDVPVWEFRRMQEMEMTYPAKQMSLYSTIWDASRWATDGGLYRVDYSYQPFVATYSNFILSGCSTLNQSDSPTACPPIFAEFIPVGLTDAQVKALSWVESNHRVYTYCLDFDRYPDLSSIPECEEERSRALSQAKPANPEATYIHIPVHTEFLVRP